MVSNQERHRAEYLDRLDLAAIFPQRFYSCRLGLSKPDPDYFAMVQQRCELRPGQLLLIDDDQRNVDGAKAAGWHAQRYPLAGGLERLRARFDFQRDPG